MLPDDPGLVAAAAEKAADPSVVAGILYDAALAPERWPAALAVLAAELEAPAAVLKAGAGDRATAPVLATTGFEPAAALALGATDPTRDPLCDAAARHPGQPVSTDNDLAVAELAASELGRLVLIPAGLTHALGVAQPLPDGLFASLWFFRPPDRPFAPGNRRTLAGWLPHLGRAVAIHQRLEAAEQASVASSHAFNRLALGAVMVDERGRPCMTNRVAERLLAASDGLSVSGDRLCGATSTATARLHDAIRETVHEGAAARRTRCTGLRLERPSHGRPFDVMVVSLAPVAASTKRGPAAIVFIADPERIHMAPERLLGDLYGLTRAEARLAMVLASGNSLGQAAAHLGVSRNTAHSQLTSIFAKTGARTQAELVRLLHRGPGAIRPYEDSAEFPRVSLLGSDSRDE